MNSLSRVSALVLSALLATTVLAGCGDDGDDGPSAKQRSAAAGVQACRSFALGGGASGDGVVRDLNAVLSEGSYEQEPLLAELQLVGTAAAGSGLLPDLTDADFQLYRAVAVAVATAQGDLAGATDLRSLERASYEAVRDSLAAVEKRCR